MRYILAPSSQAMRGLGVGVLYLITSGSAVAYTQTTFNSTNLTESPTFPLDSEPHITAWERYYSKAEEIGVFKALRSALLQLQFPIIEKS